MSGRAWTSFVLAVLVGAGCSSTTGWTPIPKSEDVKMGEQLSSELEKQAPVEKDARVTEGVARIASRLIAANGLEKDYPWELQVIRDDGTVNAFALPGGKIFVYTGLIAHADDEAEVACVLAHELTHVTHRHAAERLTDQYGAQIVEQIALGDRSAIAKVAAQAATQVGFLAFSRHQESEADEVGIQYVSKTEYDPNGMPRFFEKLQALEGKSPSVVQRFLSDHPATGDRVKTTRELIAKLPPEKQKGESYKERWVAYRTYVCPAGPKATPQTGQPAGNAPAPPPRAK